MAKFGTFKFGMQKGEKMKTLFIAALILISNIVFAGEEIIKDGEGNIVKYIISVELTATQYKAAAYDCYSVEEWVENAIHNKARQMIDVIVLEVSDKNPKKISKAEKEIIVKEAVIKSAKERQIEFEAEMKKRMEEEK